MAGENAFPADNRAKKKTVKETTPGGQELGKEADHEGKDTAKVILDTSIELGEDL